MFSITTKRYSANFVTRTKKKVKNRGQALRGFSLFLLSSLRNSNCLFTLYGHQLAKSCTLLLKFEAVYTLYDKLKRTPLCTNTQGRTKRSDAVVYDEASKEQVMWVAYVFVAGPESSAYK
uniref:Uncharacterized protein n=1 Tax=Rhipicephalus zambeziensis TaxID=60191 RepID=A0A224Y588_9ACAR